ncbi:hypothetical protein B296_00039685 [Ensete ventricosum]|uniref:Protein kinase domain-containing protein n=1 Tax=Ensete ventricosum TaxID=4639 RepID=A0A426Z5A6_ENSVE|nr:hypothetical protein B296_00039685 [Ensete ventricosum]
MIHGSSCCRNLSGSSLKGFLAPELRYLGCLQELYVLLMEHLVLVVSVLCRSLQSGCHCAGGSDKYQGLAKETDKQKQQSPQQPEWLLILEVTTGVIVVVCIITGIATAVRSCKLKSFVRIPWKKTRNWNDETPILIDGDGSQLSWLRRMKVILGVARGLRYLHTELQPPFVFSELSSNAVYLTEDFSPKV